MRKKKYFCMGLVVLQVWMLTTCTNDWQLPGNEISNTTFTVKEAKAFFEEQMMQSGNALDNKELSGFAANFTPQWNRAVVSGKDSMAAVDVPIVTDVTFKVLGWVDETQETLSLLQKLIVVKDLRNGNLGSYLVSIIPDEDYALSRKTMSAMDFSNYGDYGNFSGKIIYTFPLSSAPLRINCYREGQLTDEAAFFGCWDNPAELEATGAKMKELLSGLNLVRIIHTIFRSNELDGGMLPEVVITAPSGGNNNNSWWDDWWNQYINGNPPMPDPLNNSGGGSGGGASAAAQRIIKHFSLDNAGISDLNEVVDDLLKLCGYSFVSSYLSSNDYSFSNVSYDPNMSGTGYYDPFTGELRFKGDSYIHDAFPEELMHLFQNSYYFGGIGQYAGKTGGVNIEFEAKVMMDVICAIANGICPELGATQDNGIIYLKWIDRITDGYLRYPDYADLTARYPDCGSKNYWDFMADFKNNPIMPQYNMPIKYDLLPDALMELGGAKCN